MSRAFLLILFLAADLPAALTVNSVDALKSAIDHANTNPGAERTIWIEDGVYRLKWPHISIERDGVTIAGKSGNRDAVVPTTQTANRRDRSVRA